MSTTTTTTNAANETKVSVFNALTVDRSKLGQQLVTIVNTHKKVETMLREQQPKNGQPTVINLPDFGGMRIPTTMYVIQAVKQSTIIEKAVRSEHFIPKVAKGLTEYRPLMDDNGKQRVSSISGKPMFEAYQLESDKPAKMTKETLVKAVKETTENWLQVVRIAFLASTDKPNKTFGEGLQVMEQKMLPHLINGRNFSKGKNDLFFVFTPTIDGQTVELPTYLVDNNGLKAEYLKAEKYKGLSLDAASKTIWDNFCKDAYNSFKNLLLIGAGDTLNKRYQSLIEEAKK